MTKQEIEGILASADVGTYLQGLCDAREMTKAQLEKVINTIIDND